MAQALAGWVDADPDFERLAPVPFSTVCLRYRPRDLAGREAEPEVAAHLDDLNARLMDAVNRTGEVFLSHTRLAAGSRSGSRSATSARRTATWLGPGSCSGARRPRSSDVVRRVARRRPACPPAWHHLHAEPPSRERGPDQTVPPITELTRIEPVHLERLERQGIFTTGLLLEVSETPTRRQTLADQVDASTNDVLTWRDEALMLNLAGFGPDEHLLLSQARLRGSARDPRRRSRRVPLPRRPCRPELELETPSDLTIEGWWDQARTLEDE